MKKLIRIILSQLQKRNLAPIKTETLTTGIVCEHYRNGNRIVINVKLNGNQKNTSKNGSKYREQFRN